MNSVTQPEKGRGTMLSVVMAAAALIALLAFAPFASASNDPLASGTTTLTLDNGFYKNLHKNGIWVQRYKPATVKDRTVTLSVNGGSLDPTTGKGTIRVSGGFKFRLGHGKTRVPFKVLAISTAKNFLDGKVGRNKHKMKIATVSGVSFTRNGFGTDVSVKTMKLTRNAARQLTHKLGLDKNARGASASSADSVFKGGQVMGSASSTTQPSTVAVLAQTDAMLVPDPAGAFGKFPGHGMNPLTAITPIDPAKETLTMKGPFFTFPFTGGTLAPDATSGTVNASGGIQIAKPAGNTVQFTNLSLDFALKTVLSDNTVNGTLTGRASIADLDMSAATVTSDSAAKTITVTGAVVRLQTVSAALLNDQFPTLVPGQEFAAGDSLGTVSFTAQTQ